MSLFIDNIIIFTINGGAGKNILATAVVKAIKKKYPVSNLVILTAFPEVWTYNPDVFRCYKHGYAPYFYQNYVQNKKDIKIFNVEPYSTQDYILKTKSLLQIWCELCGVEYKNEQPELFFNQREIEFVKNNYVKNQKILVIQTNGGARQDIKISWMRDMPLSIGQAVVNNFINQYKIFHIRRDDQLPLNGVEQFKGGLRELFVLIKLSEKRCLIDSVCQHAAAAVRKPSTVLWVRNEPSMLGYSLHHNIKTDVPDQLDSLSNSLLEPYDISGEIHQCPFTEDAILFDENEIIQSIINQSNSSIKSIGRLRQNKKP